MDGWEKKPVGWEEYEQDFPAQTPHGSRNSLNQQATMYKGKNYDAIFVLAGGLDEHGNIHRWVKRRLDLCMEILKQQDKPCKVVCLGGGTYHKPPFINNKGFVVHESTACADYLIFNGVEPRQVFKEWSSYDTIANAYFALVNYIKPRRWTNILVLTSEFHMPRSRAIFEWILSLDKDLPADMKVEYASASDFGLDPEIISARKEREASRYNNFCRFQAPDTISLMHLKSKIAALRTMEDFHEWFYTEHRAYSCAPFALDQQAHVDENCRKSY